MGKNKKINIPKIDTKSFQTSKTTNPDMESSMKGFQLSKPPMVSLRYLSMIDDGHLASVFCAYTHDKSKGERKFKEIQKFITIFSDCQNIEDAKKHFCGKNGHKIKDNNPLVSKIIESLRKVKPKLCEEFITDSLDHFHTVPGHKETVLFGFTSENIFNVLYIDHKHSFSK